jgi:hypothetical protein
MYVFPLDIQEPMSTWQPLIFWKRVSEKVPVGDRTITVVIKLDLVASGSKTNAVSVTSCALAELHVYINFYE